MDPVVMTAAIKGAVEFLKAPPAAPAVSSVESNGTFNSSGWTVATGGGNAGGGSFNLEQALWVAGGFVSVLLMMKLMR